MAVYYENKQWLRTANGAQVVCLAAPAAARAGEEVVRAWCSAKPASRSMHRANALPLMCGTEPPPAPPGLLAGSTKTPSLTHTPPETVRWSEREAHPGKERSR